MPRNTTKLYFHWFGFCSLIPSKFRSFRWFAAPNTARYLGVLHREYPGCYPDVTAHLRQICVIHGVFPKSRGFKSPGLTACKITRLLRGKNTSWSKLLPLTRGVTDPVLLLIVENYDLWCCWLPSNDVVLYSTQCGYPPLLVLQSVAYTLILLPLC